MGWIREAIPQLLNRQQTYEVGLSRRRAQFVQDDLPRYAALVEEGCVFQVSAATAVAGVTALPTTTAQFSLYNNEPEDGSGKTYIVLAVFCQQVANGAALNSWGLAHCINANKPGTLPTADIAASSVKNLKANAGGYGGKAIIDLAATITDDLWTPIGGFAGTTVASLSGTQLWIPLDGAVVIPPGGMYSTAIVASATGITGRQGIVWAEVLR